ncbi:hypothetical protein MSIBF_A1590003 [groundwater metagenome]|uniref:FHA domain-containing protein n=1 Tax=groundwater metagenome TaxID=717931 RepID=A0A098E810_9ZZZZ
MKHGDNVTYTVTIWNYGLENVSVNVSDYLPKGLEVVNCPFTLSGQLCEGTVTIPARNNKTYNIIAKVTDDMTDQEFTNTIYADANVLGGHGKSSTVTGYVKDPKINIVKWADASDVEPGQEVTFYVLVNNPSETNLINLTIRDILPNGFEYKYNSSRLDGQLFNESNPQIFNVTPGAYNESSNAMQQNITWNVSNIPGKTTKLLIYKAKVHCNITKGKDANVNKVCVNYSTHDNENGSACTNYTMSGHLANLTINKYADKNSVKWFDVVEYTVIIKNPAINSAHAILKEINDTMAKNLKYINNSATINGEKINPNVIKGNYIVGTTLIWNGSTINDTAVWVGTKVVLKYKVLIMTGSNGILDNNVSLEYYDPLPGYFDPEAVFRASFRSNIVRDGYTPKQSIVETKNTKLMLGDEINTPVIITSTIYLKQGWNLISLPIQPQDTNIDAVLNNIKGKYTDVFTYNNKWIYKSEYMNKWFGDLSNLEAGKGYWIKVKEDCNLTIDGLKVKSANISLEQGWNLIGPVTTTQDNISLDNLNVQYTDVFTYEGKWIYKSEYMNKWFGDLSNLEAGKGYWIKVENNETIRQ